MEFRANEKFVSYNNRINSSYSLSSCCNAKLISNACRTIKIMSNDSIAIETKIDNKSKVAYKNVN